MFEIYDEYGRALGYSGSSYDLTCRVAHYVRELGTVEVYVVSERRAISETFMPEPNFDSWAAQTARELLK